MNRIGGTFLLAAAALSLSACATTTLASSPTPTTNAPAPTLAPTTVAPTTVAPTTVPPTTAAPTTTTEAPTTTTTTVPANQIPVEPLATPIEPVGSGNGDATAAAQQRLLDLGFWLDAADGDFDDTTQQAVMAFQKYYGLETDGSIGPITAEALSLVTMRPHGRTDAGTLVEIDKGKQLLFFVNEGAPQWIFNVSTGTEVPYEEPDQNTPGEIQTGDSITRNGLHEVYRERVEGWWEGDLGRIYRPKYFTGGIAVHGSNYIPDYPASHGCVRVSTTAMDWIWDTGIMPMGIPVWVHEGAEQPYKAEVHFLGEVAKLSDDDPLKSYLASE